MERWLEKRQDDSKSRRTEVHAALVYYRID